MHKDIPNDIAVNIKDRLRSFRYALRRSRENRPDDMAATLIDKAFSTAEAISISLVSDNPAIHESAPEVQSFGYYFTTGLEGQRAFHRDMYYLTKEVLRRNKAENVLIYEASFMTVYNRIKQQCGTDIARLHHPKTDTIQESARLCTALFNEILRQQPVRHSNSLPKNALISGYAAISLACGLATAKPVDMENADNLESAMLVVEARSERILSAVDNNDNDALQKLFATLIFHLP